MEIKNYNQKLAKINSLLRNMKLGGLEMKFEPTIPEDEFDDADFVPIKPIEQLTSGKTSVFTTIPPDHIAFYNNGRKIGELYFIEEPIRIIELDKSFEQYATKLRKKLSRE